MIIGAALRMALAGVSGGGGGGEITVTWNPNDKHADITLSEGDLKANTTVSGWRGVRATEGKSAGKWYFEITFHGNTANTEIAYIGVGTTGASLSATLGSNASGWGYQYSGKKNHNAALENYGSSYSSGQVIGIAVDLDAGKIWWAKNGAWQASGDPAAGTNPAYTNLSGTIFPMVTVYKNGACTANFGGSTFAYAPPSGFQAWNTV